MAQKNHLPCCDLDSVLIFFSQFVASHPLLWELFSGRLEIVFQDERNSDEWH